MSSTARLRAVEKVPQKAICGANMVAFIIEKAFSRFDVKSQLHRWEYSTEYIKKKKETSEGRIVHRSNIQKAKIITTESEPQAWESFNSFFPFIPYHLVLLSPNIHKAGNIWPIHLFFKGNSLTSCLPLLLKDPYFGPCDSTSEH